MTAQTMKTPQRGVLKSLDPNRTPSTNSTAAKPKSSTVVTKQEPTTDDRESKKAKFDAVSQYRICEDVDGDLSDLGIHEWSVDDFEYVRNLGSGGSATVFCAKEKQSGYHVALKVQDANEEGICEIDIHEPLDHPSIVKMIDYFFSDEPFGPQEQPFGPQQKPLEDESASPKKYLFMILELCDGGSLFDIIRDADNGYIPEKQAVAYFRGAVEAMEYLHEQDLIHCDCKPLNFLVDGSQLKLADFGMSVRNDDREVVGGSPIYMAPEHLLAWRHMTDNFDYRSDIYSLGVVLFEILVGYLPYEVLEDGDDDGAEDFLSAGLEKLAIGDDNAFQPPVLDLRKLDDQSADEPFYIPPPIFPDVLSEEAQDLILRMMEPSLEKRISLSEAKKHAWFQKFL